MTTLKTWNGIPWANIKTLNGIAKASIKTVNGVSAAAALTKYAENTSAISTRYQIGHAAETYYEGQLAWIPGANITVKRITAVISKTAGSISGYNYKCEIWNYDGTNMSTLVQASTGVTGDDTWSDKAQDFDFAGASLTSGTSYVIVMTTNATPSGANYASLAYSAAGGLVGIQANFNSSGIRQAFDGIDSKFTIWI